MDYLIHMADGEILEHHGIKGQKWGVRRYQNKDGTRTAEGKRRYSSDEDSRGIDSKTALKVGAAVVGTTAALYLATNPKARAVAAKMAKASVNSLKKAATDPKTKEFVKNNGQKLAKGLGDSLSRTGKAMTDAALISMGAIAVDKLGKKLETGENDSEYIRNRNKVILDASKAGIEAAVKGKSSSSSGNQSNGGGNVGKDVSDALGAPSKKGIDKNSSAYQALFKDSSGNQRSADVRSTVKSLASAGYDIDQINEYLRRIENGSLKHYLLGGRRMDYLIHMADGEILEHHGIKGQKWGVRRYQNADGSWTAAGKQRYGGEITKDGKYRATNGVVIAKSKNAGVAVGRRASISLVGRGLSALGTPAMAKATGRSKESISAQAAKERRALKEYYKAGGDRMFKNPEKFNQKKASEQKRNAQKQAKLQEKKEIKQLGKKFEKEASVSEKLIYNHKTRERAAKYVVKNNMSYEDAKKKANSDAKRNTAIFLAAYAGYAGYMMYKMDH